MDHVGALLEANAAKWPDRNAIVEPSGATCTFRQLRERAAAFSGFLDERGLRDGHVLLLLPVGIRLYEALLGLRPRPQVTTSARVVAAG